MGNILYTIVLKEITFSATKDYFHCNKRFLSSQNKVGFYSK